MSRHDRRDELLAQLSEAKAQFDATNARIQQRAGRNLLLALASGVAFAAVFLLCLFTARWAFVVFVAVLVTVALVEFMGAFRRAGFELSRVVVAFGGLMILAGVAALGAQGALWGLLAASALVVLWHVVTAWVLARSVRLRWRALIGDLCGAIFALVYVPFFASMAILLLELPRGVWWVFSLVVMVVSVDVGAYVAGVTLGRHKMTPQISPNKTWEGLVGATLSVIAAGVLLSVFALELPWWVGGVLGVLVLLAASGGDLVESLMKRNLGVKDMSSWLPGHGGLLDRLDSLLPSAVVVYGGALVLAGAM